MTAVFKKGIEEFGYAKSDTRRTVIKCRQEKQIMAEIWIVKGL